MPKLVVGAAIVDSLACPTRLLAAQRSYPESLAGFWEFPGGKVEPSERPEQALVREIQEELNLDIKAGALIGEYLHGRELGKATKVGFGTWLGIVLGVALKLGLAMAMLGVFAIAWFV